MSIANQKTNQIHMRPNTKGSQKTFLFALCSCESSTVSMYGALHCIKSTKGNKKGSVSFIKKLILGQQAGSLAVTGGFRTSLTDSLDDHRALLLIELRVNKACQKTISRMATLLAEHLWHVLVKQSTKGRIKRHQSPLHMLTALFGIIPSDFEKIPLLQVHPSKRGLQATHIKIPLCKDESKRADTSTIEQIKVYLDGSAHNSKVEAAAITQTCR